MGTISDVAIKYSKGRMIRQQPEGHDTSKIYTYEKTTFLKFTGRLFYNYILQINGVDDLLQAH